MKKKWRKPIAYLISILFISGSIYLINLVITLREYELNYKDYFWLGAGIFSFLWLAIMGSNKKYASKHSLAFFIFPFLVLFPLPMLGHNLRIVNKIEAFSWSSFVFLAWFGAIGVYGIVLALFKKNKHS